jgi:SAM-dependent methyltransferase
VTADAISGYSDKVSAYARYRWEYAPEAVDVFVSRIGLSSDWVVADVGSGTGMLARHLVDRVRTLHAVEPNPAMRTVATESLGTRASYREVAASSDRTTLADASIDLITVGRALHWFPAEPTKHEFRRILRPGGWLAVFSTPCTDQRLLESLRTLEHEEYGWDPAAARFTPRTVPASFYFGHDDVQTVTRAGLVRETFEMLLGRLTSHLATPRPSHPRRANFERALHDVFECHASDGLLTVPVATEIVFGQPRARDA